MKNLFLEHSITCSCGRKTVCELLFRGVYL